MRFERSLKRYGTPWTAGSVDFPPRETVELHEPRSFTNHQDYLQRLKTFQTSSPGTMKTWQSVNPRTSFEFTSMGNTALFRKESRSIKIGCRASISRRTF